MEDGRLSEHLMRRDIEIVQLRRELTAAQDEIERKVADIEAMRELADRRRAVIERVYPMQRLMRTILDADHDDLDGLITALDGVS